MTGQIEGLVPVTCNGVQLQITGLTIDDPALVAAAMEQRPEALTIWAHRLLRVGMAAGQLDLAADCIEHLLEHAGSALTGLHQAATLLSETDGHPSKRQLLQLRALQRSIHRELGTVHNALGTATDHHLYR